MRMRTLTLLLLIFGAGSSLSAQTEQDCTIPANPLPGDQCQFDNSGNGNVPYNLTVEVATYVTLEVWGGGGAGGQDNGNNNDSQGGGGGGAYARSTGVLLLPGEYTVTVGKGGRNIVGQNPRDGGESSVAGPVTAPVTLIAAGGGTGGSADGIGGTGGMVTTAGNDISNSGGDGGNRFSAMGDGGSGGGAGGSVSPGSNGTNGPNALADDFQAAGGAAGGGGAGKGGNGADTDNVPAAQAGAVPGGGGGGKGVGTTDSGVGGAGRVIVTVESILPIELYTFTARPTERAINLEWITSSEVDNEKFQIERSADGRAFSAIGELPGSGTTELRQTYTFADKNPLAGQNYYRLKQIDYDGTFDYSPVASAVFATRGKLTLFPTVTRDLVTIVTGEDAPATVRVFDFNGRLLQQQEFGAAAQRELHLGELPAGTYLISVETAGQTYQERVVKQ